jgi:hypothetical protein
LYRDIKGIVTVIVLVALLTSLLGNLGNNYVAADVMTSDEPGVIVLGEMPASELDAEKSFVTEGSSLNEKQLEMSIVPRYDVVSNFKASDLCEFVVHYTNYQLIEGDVLRITVPFNVNIDTLTMPLHNDDFIREQESTNVVTFTVKKEEDVKVLDAIVLSFQPNDVEGEESIEFELIAVTSPEGISTNSLPVKTMRAEADVVLNTEEDEVQEISVTNAEGSLISRSGATLGTLTVEKEVTVLPGETIDMNEEFEFWFIISADDWMATAETSPQHPYIPYRIRNRDGNVIATGVYDSFGNSGVSSFTLKHGEKFEVYDIPLTLFGEPITIYYRVFEALKTGQEYDVTADINNASIVLEPIPGSEWEGFGVPANALGTHQTRYAGMASFDEHVKFFNSKNIPGGNLVIKKTVTGEMADTTLPFQFWFIVSITNQHQVTDLPYRVLGADGMPTGVTGIYSPLANGGISVAPVELKHEEQLVIELPATYRSQMVNIYYNVAEASTAGYFTSAKVRGADVALVDAGWTGFGVAAGALRFGVAATLENAPGVGFEEVVEFVNHRPAVPPTGTTNLETPFWVMIIVALAMGIAYIVGKRKLRPNK